MMKRLLLFMACCAVVSVGDAQIRISLSGLNQSTKLVLDNNTQKNKGGGKMGVDGSDEYVLYRGLVRRYTWLVGQGEPITQEVANHLPFYFRLSMKNEKGHWQHIEAMHGDSLITYHNENPYFINKNYDGEIANYEWVLQIRKVAQWYITSDMSGEFVVEERAYTIDGEMVYGFIPIRNDLIHVTGSYNDSWGKPVDFNEKEGCTYGSVVYITYDKNGCDSIIDFLDGQGLRKTNTNGVDQERIIYDEQLRKKFHTSHNCVGDYVIDNWGNCGNIYEYAADGMSYTIMRVDNNLKPMRMPSNRADQSDTYIKCKVQLDEWGRECERIFLTPEDDKDTTLSGIHRVKSEYSKDGSLLHRIYYNISNSEISK